MRSIPEPGNSGDDGSADPVVATALAAYDLAGEADEQSEHHATLAALQDARVLAPLVAVPTDVEYDGQGIAPHRTSEMAAVLMTGRDGRAALLAFTCTASLIRWTQSHRGGSYQGGEARPVPVTVRQAAQSAIQEEASALLLDVAGPVLFVVEGEELRSLAAGLRLVRLQDGWGWVLR
jgi:hypothetical protein